MDVFEKKNDNVFSSPRRRYRQWSSLISFISLLLSTFAILCLIGLSDWISYKKALSQYIDGKYIEAQESFKQLEDYKDSRDYYELANNHIMYYDGLTELNNNNYYEAWNIFLNLGDFSPGEYSLKSSDLAKKAEYNYAKELYKNGEVEKALPYFEELGNYEDSKLYVSKIISASEEEYQKSVQYANAYIAYQEKRYNEALAAFLELKDYKDSAELAQECKIYLQIEKSASTISAGIQSSFAVNADYTVTSKGDDTQYFDFSDWTDIVSVSGFGMVVAGLKYDGNVLMLPELRKAEDVSDWTEIVAISTGNNYVIGLKHDGSVIGIGHNGDGQINVSSWENIIAIATAWRRTVALAADGTIYMTGYGSNGQLNEIGRANANEDSAWTDIVAIAAGGGYYSVGHTVGLKADGHVVAVGDDSWGQCQVGYWDNIIAIAAGDKHTVGLTADGRVLVAGDSETTAIDEHGAIIGWDNVVKIAAGTGYTLGLREDGTVMAVGFNEQHQIPEPQEWTSIMVYDAWNEK